MTEPTGVSEYVRQTQAFFGCRASTWDTKFGDDMPAYAAAIAEAEIPAGGSQHPAVLVLEMFAPRWRALPGGLCPLGETLRRGIHAGLHPIAGTQEARLGFEAERPDRRECDGVVVRQSQFGERKVYRPVDVIADPQVRRIH